MSEKRLITLDELEAGNEGKVVEIKGGHGVSSRLEALNLRVGKKVKKVSAMMMRGPITVDIDGKHIAMGRGMASKVIVEIA